MTEKSICMRCAELVRLKVKRDRDREAAKLALLDLGALRWVFFYVVEIALDKHTSHD